MNWIQQAQDRIQYRAVVKLRFTTNWDGFDQLTDISNSRNAKAQFFAVSAVVWGLKHCFVIWGRVSCTLRVVMVVVVVHFILFSN